MKIMFDHQIFVMQKFGGISRYFTELMKIEANGFSVEKIDPDLFRGQDIPEVKNDILSRGFRYLKKRSGIGARPRKAELPASVTELFSNSHYDIFHPTYYDPYFLEYNRKPMVLTVYDMIHEIYRESFGLSDQTSENKRLLCSKADQVICISETTKHDLISILNIDKDKVHAILLASDFDKVTPLAPAGMEGVNNYILFTGARWAYKNFYFTATALADILKSDKTLQLLCTGHEFSNEEMHFFKTLGIGEQVKHVFLKNDAELAWVYRNARLFIFPSLYEGFGFPLLEAFASHCPVASSKGGSLLEVGGDAVLFFDPKNIAQIQDAVNSGLYNSAVREELIEKGKKRFEKYSWDNCRIRTKQVYELALSTANNT